MSKRAKPAEIKAHRLCTGCANVPESSQCPACGKLAVHDWNDKPQSFWKRDTNLISCDHCTITLTCTITVGKGAVFTIYRSET